MENNKIEKSIFFSLLGNIFLAGFKWIVGIFGNSYALIADAIESTADIFSSILVLIGIKYSHRPADKNHPYGHGRIEPLITFLVVFFLLSSACVIIYQSIQNIIIPHKLPEKYTVVVLLIIIIIKEVIYYRIHKKSKELNSSTLKAEAWHHRSDSISSFSALIGISIALYFGEGYESADDFAAIIAAFLIIYNAYLIFRPAFGEIMDEQIYDNVEKQIYFIAEKNSEVKSTEKCFIRKVGIYYWIDLHLRVDENKTVRQGHTIAHEVKDAIKNELKNVREVLIHVEPYKK